MKKTLKTIVLMAIIMIILSIANISNAYSFNAELSKSTDKLDPGTEVKVTLNLSNIDMNTGIQSIKVGKITVGDAFENITSSSFSSTSWMPTYSNGGLVLMSGTPVTNAGNVVTLTLKVKSGNTLTSSTVTFQDIVASAGTSTGDIKIDKRTVTIGAQDDNSNDTPYTPVTNNNDKQNVPANKAKNTISSSKTTAKRILNAGDTTTIIIASVVAIVAIVGCLGFIKYAKNKDIK